MNHLSHTLIATVLAGTALSVWTISQAAEAPAPTIHRDTDGRFEVHHPGGRIIGLVYAEHDQVAVRWVDLNGDGRQDLVVSNALPVRGQAGGPVPVPGPGAPSGTMLATAGATSASGGMVTVYNIVTPAEGLPKQLDLDDLGDFTADSAPFARSIVGDHDNFGFRFRRGTMPCVFYDRREEEDLGIFDHEVDDASDQIQKWTHAFEVAGRPIMVKLVTQENFSDRAGSTVRMDRVSMPYAVEPFAGCATEPGGLRRVFVLNGSDARIAADGEVTVVFKEGGDNIVLDHARLVVKFRP